MLEKMVPQLLEEMEIDQESLPFTPPAPFLLPLEEGVAVAIQETPEGGLLLKSSLALYPQEKEEAFFMHALHGNLFGQGTNNAALGISSDGKSITLTRIVEYPVDYSLFREIVEDFINAIDFWRTEIMSHNNLRT